MEKNKELIGLTSKEVDYQLKKYGPNILPDYKSKRIIKILKYLASPISLMLLAAALLSLYIHRVFDFFFILSLVLINFIITFWQEQKADSAIKKLNQQFAISVKVLRDNKWAEVPSSELVPDDIIEIDLGNVVPADCILLRSKHLSINESMITGESLPKEKKLNDKVYSGSFVTSGSAYLKVTNTGRHTYFGKTFSLVERVKKKSILEKDIVRISQFLSALSILSVVILSIVFLSRGYAIAELLTISLSILIAGIPISLPTVMTLIIEVGVISLAKKNVIVRRISALQDLSNVSLLLTDKTGTLTENKIVVKKILTYDHFSRTDVLHMSALNAFYGGHNAIDKALLEEAKKHDIDLTHNPSLSYAPFEFKSKMSSLKTIIDKKEVEIFLGAPQVIKDLCTLSKSEFEKFESDINSFAQKGYRSLAVCTKEKGTEGPKMAGLIALSDMLRKDTKDIINYLSKNNIDVAMLTGDNREIARQIAQEVGITGPVVKRDEIARLDEDQFTKDFLTQHLIYAEILPDDKLKLVERAKKFFIVAVTGDGVNDLPAAKAANVGIAVKGAVAALKTSADIVLLTDGIGVIKDAIFEARRIFSRIYSYSIYRISESYRLIISITIIGVLNGIYPLTVLQLILLALLNDIPIISLAYDKVEAITKPAKINVKKRFILSSVFGSIGVLNSILLFFILRDVFHYPLPVIQTVYFLKLSISGHLLIYIAHTKKRWYKLLPSKQVIWATSLTQIAATILAFTGIFMPAKISLPLVVIVWIWTLLWMQITEISKSFIK